jgi:large subunit ribosomal protein L25
MSQLNDLTLKVALREESGRYACKKLRSSGRIPIIYYGKDLNKSYSLEEREFRQLMRNSAGAASLFRLQSGDGEDELALIKEMQRHPLTDAILHIDFIHVTRGQELQTKVPLEMVGEAVGVKMTGGILEVSTNEVEVRCRPSALPSSIEVDITDLVLGDNLQVKDLPEIDGVSFPGDPLQVLVACVASASGRASADDEDIGEETDIAEGEEGDSSSEEGEVEKTDDSEG